MSEALDQARLAHARGDHDEALRLVHEILDEDPEDEAALALLEDIVIATKDEGAAPTVPAAAPDLPAMTPSTAAPSPLRFGDLRADDGRRSMPAKRPAPPLGALVVGVVDVVGGGIVLVLALMLLTGGAPGAGILLMLIGAVALTVGVGMVRLRNWAWVTSFFLTGVGTLATLVDPASAAEVALSLVSGGLMFVLLVLMGPAFGTVERPGAPLDRRRARQADMTLGLLVLVAIFGFFLTA